MEILISMCLNTKVTKVLTVTCVLLGIATDHKQIHTKQLHHKDTYFSLNYD